MEWLVEADIVRALLRAHLHQRQYMDQVQRVLKILAAEGGFQSDHLELLWALTEKARPPPTCSRARSKCIKVVLYVSSVKTYIAQAICEGYGNEPTCTHNSRQGSDEHQDPDVYCCLRAMHTMASLLGKPHGMYPRSDHPGACSTSLKAAAV